jgi:glyoxylase-like metal-dependent hydrolase (beta-lactamase superfamily II)
MIWQLTDCDAVSKIFGMAVKSFFHRSSGTVTHLLHEGRDAAIIDPCLDFDFSEMRIGRESLNEVMDFVRTHELDLHWILETHIHADHVTGAAVLSDTFPAAKVAISARVEEVRKRFTSMFNFTDEPIPPFDHLLKDGDTIDAGSIQIKALATPGHTPACMSFFWQDCLFTGDSLFLPEQGTGRCDFPGGDADKLFESIQKIYQLPDHLKVFVGHTYPPENQAPTFETVLGEEKSSNVHVKPETSRADFVHFRKTRDEKLSLPKLYYPSLYLNLRGGRLPEKDQNGHRLISLPIFDTP